MKDILYLFVLALCWIFISCESSVQPKQNVVNESPIITISGIDSSMLLGDTLKLILHVSDVMLKNGSVNFGDSNTVVFNKNTSVIDTTLYHYYKAKGEYGITVSFNDGERVTTQYYRVIVINFFPPSITIVSNKTSLILFEDTLRMTLHVSDPSLSNGFVDFNDGTVMTFTHLYRALDTTFEHIYSHFGKYSVTASFGDGEKVTTKNLDVTVSDPPPIITIKVDTTSLSYGDTLKIKIHAFDRTLSSGLIYFGDGTSITFSNLNRVFDTTLVHCYSLLAYLHVTATFSDGNTSASSAVALLVSPKIMNRYYELPLSIGMVWRYLYKKGSSSMYLSSYDQWGIHEWKIMSSSVLNQDTIFTVRQIIRDSVFVSAAGEPSRRYAIKDTSLFTIISSKKKNHFNAPLSGRAFDVPNHTVVNSYPIVIGGDGYSVIFEDNYGLTSYHSSYGAYHFYSAEDLTLIKFEMP